MKKRWITAVIAGIALSAWSAMGSMASEEAEADSTEAFENLSHGWQWKEDSVGWMFVTEDGTYKKNCWEQIDGSWYYFDYEGYMCTDWTKIGGTLYLFDENGELQLGWCYNEDEEKWHYYNEDGTAQKGWFQDTSGSWYWFSSKGEMASTGYKYVSGGRYYFFDNGQMAANQYVGLAYMDENGIRNRNFDIVVEGSKGSSAITEERKDAFTEASKNIPREWVKRFISEGWEILYYPDKPYFSAPDTGNGRYYVCHKLDTTYRKIKICNPAELTEAFSEFIGYEYGCYEDQSQEATDLMMNKDQVDEFVYIPDYYEDDMEFYFGKLAGAYLGSASTRSEMEETAPSVTRILKKILYGIE